MLGLLYHDPTFEARRRLREHIGPEPHAPIPSSSALKIHPNHPNAGRMLACRLYVELMQSPSVAPLQHHGVCNYPNYACALGGYKGAVPSYQALRWNFLGLCVHRGNLLGSKTPH